MTDRDPVLAVDVGGTSIKTAVLDAAGGESLRRAVPTPFDDGPDAVVAAIRDLVCERTDAAASAGAPVRAVGLVVPGVVDTEAGIARYASNIGWRDAPLRDIVGDAVGLPTAVGHDVQAAGLAEATVGAAQDVPDALIVVLGTGIAAVVVSGGVVVRGAAAIPGEIGHIPVGDLETRCRCGAFGCLEMFSSARGVARLYAERTGRSVDPTEIVAHLDDDPDAAAVWQVVTATLARGLVAGALITDPARVVLAGGLSRAGDTLLAPTRAAFEAGMPWREAPELVASPLGERAGLLGAGILARAAAGATP
ncbi:MAG TPA: ROK family protein [Flexivirga sp.]|uniref:ROK family protein n=1 Tax=Flexivirga sp. TaxID=1962927 RepID=UPI002B88D7E3|nr:ROK family protein [Flexivirga sp.]HWC22627.1 ROK family protein [Flexivirga sp.]